MLSRRQGLQFMLGGLFVWGFVWLLASFGPPRGDGARHWMPRTAASGQGDQPTVLRTADELLSTAQHGIMDSNRYVAALPTAEVAALLPKTLATSTPCEAGVACLLMTGNAASRQMALRLCLEENAPPLVSLTALNGAFEALSRSELTYVRQHLDDPRRANAINALCIAGKNHMQGIAKYVIAGLRSSDLQLSQAAIGAAVACPDPAQNRVLIAELEKHQQCPSSLLIAAIAKLRLHEAGPVLYRLLRKNPQMENGSVGLWAFGEIGYAPALPLIRHELDDPRMNWQRAALDSMGKLGDASDLSVLTARLSAATPGDSVLCATIRAVGRLLKRACNDTMHREGFCGILALPYHTGERALRRLACLCNDPNPTIRRAALCAVGDASTSGCATAIRECRDVYAKVPPGSKRDSLWERLRRRVQHR